ncbi:MAG TPA: hypothetical protein VF623_04965 [Segetibacter sp.]|jgi:hypothetical protein
MKKASLLLLLFSSQLSQSFGDSGILYKKKKVIVWQPSHQTDTGKDFSEAAVCNGIVEAAMETKPMLKEYKVSSLGIDEVHHANRSSNTVIEHTTAIIDGKISGYAKELQKSNKQHPEVFIAVHNNGGTKRYAIWGYIHYGDKFASEMRPVYPISFGNLSP